MVPRGGAGHHARLPASQSQAGGEPALAVGRWWVTHTPLGSSLSESPSTSGGAKVGVREHIMATLSRTRRMPRRWHRWRTTLPPYLPTFRASCLPSPVMSPGPGGATRPTDRESARTRHLSVYFLDLRSWACSTACALFVAHLATRADWSALVQVKSRQVSSPLD